MPILTPLRSVAASAVALTVAASAGLVLASTPATSVVDAFPAPEDTAAEIERELAERQALINSRAAEREALQAAVQTAAQQRSLALAGTSDAIGATDSAIQAQREAERIAAEKRAAEEAARKKAAEEAAAKKAAEEAARKKAAAAKAAADKAAAEKAAAEKKTAEQAARKPAPAPAVQGGTRAQNRELGRQLALSMYGWGGEQFTCYDNIIMRESLWDHTAQNPRSSAYGIPQSLPGNKMATEGADWRTNPATQIRWGLKYVKQRYGTPCNAWAFKRANGWY